MHASLSSWMRVGVGDGEGVCMCVGVEGVKSQQSQVSLLYVRCYTRRGET